MAYPRRGDLWLAQLEATAAPSGLHPVLVVSVDEFNRAAGERVIVVPVTSRTTGSPFEVPLAEPIAGLHAASWARCDSIHAISTPRLVRRLGEVDAPTMTTVEDRVLRLIFTRPEG